PATATGASAEDRQPQHRRRRLRSEDDPKPCRADQRVRGRRLPPDGEGLMPIFISQDVDEVVNEPLIGWHDLLRTGTVANIGDPSDAPRRNALNGLTYNYWRLGTGTQTLEVSLGGSQPVDYVGIAAHTLGSAGRRVRVQRGTSNAHSEAWFAPSTDA